MDDCGCSTLRRCDYEPPAESMNALPIDEEDFGAVLEKALRAGGHWAEVFLERRATETLRLAGGGVAEIRSDLDLGAGVRVVTAGRAGYAYTNVVTRRSLVEAAAAAAVASGATSSARAALSIDLRQRPVLPAQHARRPPTDVTASAKVELLRRVDTAARSAGVRDVTATHVDVTQSMLVATTDSGVAEDTRVRTRLTCQVSARRNGRMQTGFDGPGIGGGMELYDGDAPEAIGVRAAERALRALNGIESPSGRLPVILGPSGGGLLLHEACGHGLEADALTRGSSIYAHTSGERVGSELVTAVDDPTIAAGFGSYAIDDEGAEAVRTVLLDRGVQTGALSDRSNPIAGTTQISANGRRASYAHPPLSRMSNTFILPGGSSVADLLGSIERGVYVVRLRGGDVDVTSGEFAFTAAETFLIENGEIGPPLLSLSLLGNGPDALASVEAVADDLSFTQALCGKADQWIPVSYGSPTLLIGGLTVTGAGSG